jgi:DNA-binding MarR family transcriptional regulator
MGGMARRPDSRRGDRDSGRARAARRLPGSAFAARRRTPRQAANAELHIALLKVANRLSDDFGAIMKPVDLSLAQYNVLRILRGAGPEGASCGDVIQRLIRRDPDVTRLLDRLERRGLIERFRDPRDRRSVRAIITREGLDLLASLDDPIDEMHARHLGHLSDGRLADLRAALDSLNH